MQKVKLPKQKSNQKHPWIVLAIVISIILTLIILPDLLPNPSLKQEDKEQIKHDISRFLSSSKLPGELVYQDIDDTACKEDMPRYFEMYYSCSVIGERYFKTSADQQQTLNTAKEQLVSLNFTNVDPESPLYLQLQLSSRVYKAEITQYTNMKNLIDANSHLRPIVKDGKLAALAAGEHYYRIRITSEYYSCNNSGPWMERSCPTPPSQPK